MKLILQTSIFLLMALSIQSIGWAKTISTNAAYVYNAPEWMKRVKIEKSIARIQSKLEWSTRRVKIYYHNTEQSFQKTHSLGPTPRAVTIKSKKQQTVQLSPRVNANNYQEIIAHEMVHIIFYQKYSGAIPGWLEEGFANHLSKRTPVNYKWLSQQKLAKDVTQLNHPFKQNQVSVRVHYKTSQALVEMLEKKCNLNTLLQLSVQRKMQDYIKTYCKINDINSAFKQWVASKSKL